MTVLSTMRAALPATLGGLALAAFTGHTWAMPVGVSATMPTTMPAGMPETAELNGAPARTRAVSPLRWAQRLVPRPSPADKLRIDAVQRAAVPMPPTSGPLPVVRLSAEQRAVARHIARQYRVAADRIDAFVHYAFKVARDLKLDPHLVLAIMAVESSFDPLAESRAGAQGLMQVHTRVHTERFAPFGGVEAVWDPLANIRVGAKILVEYLQRYGDVAGALKAYVGAALLPHDGGYGNKVLSMRDQFVTVVGGKPRAPALTAANQSGADLPRPGVGL